MARLTIPDEQTFAEFSVVTSTTEFPISFSLFAKADLTVLVDGVELDGSAFTFTGTPLDGGGYDGGTVTLNTAVDDVTLRIERNVAITRTSNFAPANTTPVGAVDQALNRLTAISQDLDRAKLEAPTGDLAGLYLAFDAEGQPITSSGTGADAGLRTDLAASGGSSLVRHLPSGSDAYARSLQARLRELAVPVLDFIDPNLHAGIVARTLTDNLEAELVAASAEAAVQGRPLELPAGTIWANKWEITQGGLTVLTSGYETQLRQTTGQASTRFIQVKADSVRLWTGSSISIQGNISTDSSEFNSAVHLDARLVDIGRFEMGDLYAKDIRGDAFETSCAAATGSLGHIKLGKVFVDNCYRNGVSITAGDYGQIEGVYQVGGVGLYVFDAEPDPTSTPLIHWQIGQIVGRRVGFVGDPAVGIGSVEVGQMDMNWSLHDPSVPAYPGTFSDAIVGRNYESVRIGHLRARGVTRRVLNSIGGDAVGDDMCDEFRVGYADIDTSFSGDCGFTLNTKLRHLQIDYVDCQKVAADDPLIQGNSTSLVTIGGGVIEGQIIRDASFRTRIIGTTSTGGAQCLYLCDHVVIESCDFSAENVFSNCNTVAVRNSSLDASNIVFLTSTRITAENSNISWDNLAVSGGDENLYAINSTLGGTAYAAGWYARRYQQALQFGDMYIWPDSTGDLRIKSSAPSSDTDGTIVGTQS